MDRERVNYAYLPALLLYERRRDGCRLLTLGFSIQNPRETRAMAPNTGLHTASGKVYNVDITMQIVKPKM